MRIILHFGMHKTGSTSIQTTLFKNAEKLTTVYYPTLNAMSHNGMLINAFSKQPRKIHKTKAVSLAEFTEQKKRALSKLEQLLSLHQGRDILLSSEVMLTLKIEELQDMLAFLQRYSSDIQLLGYVRPPASYIPSAFQQVVKGGSLDIFDLQRHYPYYKTTLRKFEQVFGQKNISYWKFDPNNFPEGCVVRDFCERLGIEIAPENIVRVNEGISLPAISLLYAYSRYGHGIGVGKNVRPEYKALLEIVAQLPGEKLRFSSSLIQEVLDSHDEDIKWMEARLGTSLIENKKLDDPGNVQAEADLLKFTPKTLKWLAGQLGGNYRWHPRMTIDEVVEWMHALRLKLATQLETASLEKQAQRLEKRALKKNKNAKLFFSQAGNKNSKALLAHLKENTPRLASLPDLEANLLIKKVFKQICDDLKATDKGVMPVSGLGRFSVRENKRKNADDSASLVVFQALKSKPKKKSATSV